MCVLISLTMKLTTITILIISIQRNTTHAYLIMNINMLFHTYE